MTEKMLAYCGLDCADCLAYKAYITDDEQLRLETAQQWTTPEYSVVPADINCVGCKSAEGPHFEWCGECPMRACGKQRRVETCAHCGDFICDNGRQARRTSSDLK